jgi:hypothetical protein
MPRYFKWLTKRIFCPFNVRWTSGSLSIYERSRWLESYLQWFLCPSPQTMSQHLDLAAASWEALFVVCRIYAKRPRWTPVVWGISFIYALYNVGDFWKLFGQLLLDSLITYHTENTASNNSSVAESHAHCHENLLFSLCCYLEADHFFWLHYSVSQASCHSALHVPLACHCVQQK